MPGDNDNDKGNSIGREDHGGFGEDEDNNPFSHQGGITSFMGQPHHSKNGVAENGGDDEGYGGDDDDDVDDESLLLYNSHPNQPNGESSSTVVKESFNEVQIDHESRVSKLLKPNNNVKVEITEAGNSNEGMVNSSKKYVVYTLKLINLDVPKEEVLTRRRYSDFESLRDILTKIFPLIIIPPIPPKNYLNLTVLNGLVGSSQHGSTTNGTSSSGDSHPAYSYINSTHLNKNKLIEHRKRLLANFLNNCLKLTRIRSLQFFAKFLDPNANWTDEIALITSQLPKSIYLSNPENGLKTDPIYSNLPNPSNSNTISFFKDNRKKLTKKTTKLLNGSNPDSTTTTAAAAATSTVTATTSNGTDQQPQSTNGSSTLSIEKIANSEYILNTSDLDLINKKIMANYMGLSNDYAELGTIFNSFSLILSESSRESKNKDESKANVIFDKIGQAFDRSYITINVLIGDLETKFSEPLGEAVQYTSILQFISKFQSRKVKQKELLDSELKAKRKELEELLHVEDESARIDNAVKADVVAKNSKYNLEDATSRGDKSPSPTKASSAGSTYSRFKLFPTMNSIKKITQYVSEIIDQNPEQTRKQRILVLQEKIKTFEKCQSIMLEDISYITDEVNKDFQAFHKEQLKMIYEILLCYNRFLIGWAKKNIEIWEEIKEEVSKL